MINDATYCVCILLLSLVLFIHIHKETKQEITETKQEITVMRGQTNFIIVKNKFNTDTEITRNFLKDVTVTSYNNHYTQTDGTPNITATNRPVREGIVAVSRDLLNNGTAHYGDLLYISCFDKWYTIEDTMNKRFEKRVDVFLFDKQESIKINKKCNIEIIHYNK